MTSRNPDAVANQGEFHARVPPIEPLTSKGVSSLPSNLTTPSHPSNTHQHQPGRLVGNDKVLTFEAEVLPPGSAPKKDTYQPNPTPNSTTRGYTKTHLQPSQVLIQPPYTLVSDTQARAKHPRSCIKTIGRVTV